MPPSGLAQLRRNRQALWATCGCLAWISPDGSVKHAMNAMAVMAGCSCGSHAPFVLCWVISQPTPFSTARRNLASVAELSCDVLVLLVLRPSVLAKATEPTDKISNAWISALGDLGWLFFIMVFLR